MKPLVHAEHEGAEVRAPLPLDRRASEEQIHQHRLAAADGTVEVKPARRLGGGGAEAQQAAARTPDRAIASERVVQPLQRRGGGVLRSVGPQPLRRPAFGKSAQGTGAGRRRTLSRSVRDVSPAADPDLTL
jgi:hypothetical protein